MDNQKLIEYVKTIYEIESSMFMMDNLITKIKKRSKELRSYKEQNTYSYEKKPTFFDEDYRNDFAISVFFGVVALFVFSGWNTFFPAKGLAIILSFIVGKLIHFIVGYLIGVIFFTIIHYISYSLQIKKWKQNNANIDNINNQIQEQNKQEWKLINQKLDLLYEQREKIEEKNNETFDTLNAYYNLDIIYPKYRNFVAISSIYEYLLSGRCNKLEGHGGAYDTFEYESRLDHIIIQLDQVIDRLDQIQNNQYQLYSAIENGFSQSNALFKSVANGINRLETSQELNNYYNKITAQNTEYFKMVHFYGRL